jgi:hypothetical protein
MRPVSCLIIILLAAIIIPGLASAADQGNKVVLYNTDFTQNPGWTTNNPTRYFWDAQNGRYHYLVEGATGGYAFVKVPYSTGPFTLEYDFYPVRTDKDAAFRFGLGSSEMDVTRGTVVLSEFTNIKYGKLMGLRVITQSNNLLEVTSQSDSYCGENPGCGTKNYEDGQAYHVVLRYDPATMSMDMRVSYKGNGTQLWGYYVNSKQDLHFMNRLMISSVGDYTGTGVSAEGYIDNVDLYLFEAATPAPTTSEITTAPVTTTRPTAVPTSIPTTKSPPGALLAPAAIIIAGLVCLALRR